MRIPQNDHRCTADTAAQNVPLPCKVVPSCRPLVPHVPHTAPGAVQRGGLTGATVYPKIAHVLGRNSSEMNTVDMTISWVRTWFATQMSKPDGYQRCFLNATYQGHLPAYLGKGNKHSTKFSRMWYSTTVPELLGRSP